MTWEDVIKGKPMTRWGPIIDEIMSDGYARTSRAVLDSLYSYQNDRKASTRNIPSSRMVTMYLAQSPKYMSVDRSSYGTEYKLRQISKRDIIKTLDPYDKDWQKKLQEEISSKEWDEEEGEEVHKPENRINPMNTEHLMDIFYIIAREIKGRHVKPEHRKLVQEHLPHIIEQEKIPGITEEHIDAMVQTKDEDTDERDERMGYSHDPLH